MITKAALQETLTRLRDERVLKYRPNWDIKDLEARNIYDKASHMDWCRGFDTAQDLLIPLIEKMKLALQECSYFCQDQIARTNKAIATDCPNCDYQCEACIHSIDDCESTKKKIIEALSELKNLEEGLGK